MQHERHEDDRRERYEEQAVRIRFVIVNLQSAGAVLLEAAFAPHLVGAVDEDAGSAESG